MSWLLFNPVLSFKNVLLPRLVKGIVFTSLSLLLLTTLAISGETNNVITEEELIEEKNSLEKPEKETQPVSSFVSTKKDFILVLYICSISNNNCVPPLQNELIFNDWYSCMATGHEDALDLYANLNIESVNEEKVAIGFECSEIQTEYRGINYTIKAIKMIKN